MANNTTCDIYRAASGPPVAPDVANVPCYLAPSKEFSSRTGLYFTHLMMVASSVDVRDDLNASVFAFGINADRVFVPSGGASDAVEFRVVLVRRIPFGGGKQVLLSRVPGGAVPWPTSNL